MMPQKYTIKCMIRFLLMHRSGLGVLRHKPEIKYSQSQNSIKSLVELQLQILENVKDNIKPGGTIVYSTCTIEQMENENVIYTF